MQSKRDFGELSLNSEDMKNGMLYPASAQSSPSRTTWRYSPTY